MRACRFIIALVAFSGIIGGSFAQTGVINDKMASDPSQKTDIFGGNLTVQGYYDVLTTVYLRNVRGILWATRVVYTGKTIAIQGYMKDVDGDFNYGYGTVNHVRPNGIVDQVSYTVQPYINGMLSYLPVNARDWHQYVDLRPQARINSSNIGGNIRINGPWSSKRYPDVSNGQVFYMGVGTWQLTDFPNLIW